MNVEFVPIGIVHSGLCTPGAPPIQSRFSRCKGTVEVFPEYTEGLKNLGGFSHLILICHFNRSKKQALSEKPLMDGSMEHGIFATRHFNRPNPIGIGYVALERIEGNILHVSGLDLLDGTPILDIKPYIPAFDSIPDAKTGWVTEDHLSKLAEVSAKVQETPDGAARHA
ncbi:MAG: tRNA (N6-threonylcarbamoyladenosine(37)-N6)-methyltransferase TrmO [Methanoregula sp.]|jgi:tRNA-Thr(GGU) m(6)t(6)A37 methyltransferase TsaA